MKKGFNEIINKDFREWNILAFDGKEIVGFLILRGYDTYYSINLISITPKNRGKGYARLLLRKAEYEFFRKGGTARWLESTDERNSKMIKCFENYGFHKSRELFCFARG